jgi:hypothetical protein
MKTHDHDYKAIFGYAKVSDFEGYVWLPETIQAMEDLLNKHYRPYTTEGLEGWILTYFKEANEEPSPGKRADLLEKAQGHAFMQYHEYRPALEASKPMTEEVKAMLKELNQSRRPERGPVELKPKKKAAFEDPDKQLELCTKYPWAVPGSFVVDPAKAGGTLVLIKCECTKTRQVHLSDLFQVKKCYDCKKLGK